MSCGSKLVFYIQHLRTPPSALESEGGMHLCVMSEIEIALPSQISETSGLRSGRCVSLTKMVRLILIAALLGVVNGQIFGMGNKRNGGMSDEEANHMMGTPQGSAAVDRAMQGWDDLANSPDQMQEVMESFKDPEVMAKAKEVPRPRPFLPAACPRSFSLQCPLKLSVT
jgi:hypothetical protein